jgi:hypothetical protein
VRIFLASPDEGSARKTPPGVPLLMQRSISSTYALF